MPARRSKVIPINADAAFSEAIKASQEAMREKQREHFADYYERLPEYRRRIAEPPARPVHESVLRTAKH